MYFFFLALSTSPQVEQTRNSGNDFLCTSKLYEPFFFHQRIDSNRAWSQIVNQKDRRLSNQEYSGFGDIFDPGRLILLKLFFLIWGIYGSSFSCFSLFFFPLRMRSRTFNISVMQRKCWMSRPLLSFIRSFNRNFRTCNNRNVCNVWRTFLTLQH